MGIDFSEKSVSNINREMYGNSFDKIFGKKTGRFSCKEENKSNLSTTVIRDENFKDKKIEYKCVLMDNEGLMMPINTRGFLKEILLPVMDRGTLYADGGAVARHNIPKPRRFRFHKKTDGVFYYRELK